VLLSLTDKPLTNFVKPDTKTKVLLGIPKRKSSASTEPNSNPSTPFVKPSSKAFLPLSGKYLHLHITTNTLAPIASSIGIHVGSKSSAITMHGKLALNVGKLPTATLNHDMFSDNVSLWV
jgi:hypothetical protein